MVHPITRKLPSPSMSSLLTLDQSTLFYWTLSDSYLKNRRPNSTTIKEWVSALPSSAEPVSRAPSHITGRTNKSHSSHSKSVIPSLTSGTSRSSAPSILTNNITIVSHAALNSVKVKAEPVPDTITLHSDGGLSDNDETKGEEREAAIKSPPKGKK
jgi:hypothetical protein